MFNLESKTKRQEHGANKWRDSGGRGTLWYHMGFGKTRTAIYIIDQILTARPSEIITIVVPSEALLSQWKKVLASLLPDNKLVNIIIYTSHYLIENNFKFSTYLLIVDEIHEFTTEERLKIVNGSSIHYKFILGLTGTYEDKENRYLKLIPYAPVVDRITEKECKDHGWISDYIEYNLSCNLTNTERMLYDHYSAEIKAILPIFGRNGLEIASKCLGGGKDMNGVEYNAYAWASMWAYRNNWRNDLDLTIEANQEINNKYNPSILMGKAKKLLVSIKQRKDIIYNAVRKFELAVEVCNRFPNRKAIIFNQSTTLADRFLNSLDDCVVYHSNLHTIEVLNKDGKLIKLGKKRRKDLAVQAIQSGKAKRIATVNALNTGFDVDDIGLSVTTCGVQNPTQNDQRKSRATRLNSKNQDDIAIIVNIYIKSTVENPSIDETWLRKRQRNSTNDIYWIDSVDEIVIM